MARLNLSVSAPKVLFPAWFICTISFFTLEFSRDVECQLISSEPSSFEIWFMLSLKEVFNVKLHGFGFFSY